MKDYTELFEQLKKVCEGVSEMAGHSDDWTTHDWLCYETGLDSIEAIRELQKRNIELLSYAEKLDEHEAKLQGKIEALQEQVKEYEQALTDLAISPSPGGKYWKDFACDELNRIKAMGVK